jgi:ankyrin repeat protein
MSSNNLAIVTYLLGSDNIIIDKTESAGRTPLHDGCINNSDASVRLFLAHPSCTVDIINKRSVCGDTAVMEAAIQGYTELVKLLTPHSDISINNNIGETVIDIARYRGHQDIVNYLLKFIKDQEVRASHRFLRIRFYVSVRI